MHEAEQYLRNPQNPPSLHVIIGGKKRRLFINRDQGQIGIVAPKKKYAAIHLARGIPLRRYAIHACQDVRKNRTDVWSESTSRWRPGQLSQALTNER